ncbi:MAG: hypothetical protein ACFFD1_01370 [Candidatus Thorarchaeota archaeon]
MLQNEPSKVFIPKSSNTSALHWSLQRFTGALLLLLIGIHMLVVHFIPLGLSAAEQFGVASYQATYARLSGGWFFAIDWVLLVLAIYHGLNGVRTVVLDFSPKRSLNIIFTVLFIVVGIGAIIYGTWILYVVAGTPASA